MKIGYFAVVNLVIAFFICQSAQAQQQGFTVGPVTAAPGQVASGFIDVPAGVDEGTRIPLSVFHGRRPGPVLALVAGNHGYEYTSILALQRLRTHLDPQTLAGTVIMVHVANMPSFLRRTIYYSPVDGKNLNRVYPGKKDGTVSERIAYAITKEVIERCDYLADLHCGDGNESLRPYLYWQKTGNTELDEKSKQMALAFGMDHIVIDTERPPDPNQSMYCANTAETRGKPAITTESGGLGRTDEESVARIEQGVMNLLRLFHMVEGEPSVAAHPLWIDRSEVIRSQVTGLFYPLVEKGVVVKEGTVLGSLTDFFGQRIADVRAPFSGVLLYILGTPPVSANEPLAFVGHILQESEHSR
jgi:hypothetical protein